VKLPAFLACPECSSERIDLVTSRATITGGKRRRWRCLDCRQRWTTYEGEQPARLPRRGLSPEQVRRVLLSTGSDSEVGRQFGLSHTAIANLRLGRTYAELWPELPRRSPARSCRACRHWRSDHCNMGFPDPIEEGVKFAAECELFEHTTTT
jgi:hypothetical protein